MKRFTHFFKRSVAKKVLLLVLIATMVVPINYHLGVNKVEAGASAVWVVQDTSATNVGNALANTTETTKSTFLDAIFNLAAKVFLRAMVRSIIQWINSGFRGAPTFVTDLKGFVVDVADQIAGEFIYESDALNFLCSPFQLDVKIALAFTYSQGRQGNYEPQCRLSDVVNNIDGFLNNSFPEGGWPGWVELTLSEESNPQKAFINAQSQMYARILNEQGEEVTKLDFGNGFFSLETCDVSEQGTSAAPNCTIGTPGSVIANSINKALGAEQDVLIAADEVNEIFNALIMQIFRQVFEGAYGLLGIGGNASYTNYNWDTGSGASTGQTLLDAQRDVDADTTLDTSIFTNSNPINQAIVTEQDYMQAQFDIIGRIDAVENRYVLAEVDLSSRGCSLGFSFPTKLEADRTNATFDAAIASDNINTLNALSQAYASSSNATEQNSTLQQFYSLRDSGVLHTNADISNTQLYMQYDVEIAIQALDADIATAQAACP